MQLEARIEDLQKEVKAAKDRLVSQDAAAKTTIQQLHKEMTFRTDQVTSHSEFQVLVSDMWVGS